MAELSVKSGWQAVSIVRGAEERLRTELVACIGALKPRTTELATLLAGDPAFRQVSTASARQRFADDWLLAHSDGLRLESWFVKEIAVQAHRAGEGRSWWAAVPVVGDSGRSPTSLHGYAERIRRRMS
ncbi:hypothetical protein [Amycolatopsis thermoflava]|nr:hypothetical protein [Amycolatopsis thermoflava]